MKLSRFDSGAAAAAFDFHTLISTHLFRAQIFEQGLAALTQAETNAAVKLGYVVQLSTKRIRLVNRAHVTLAANLQLQVRASCWNQRPSIQFLRTRRIHVQR